MFFPARVFPDLFPIPPIDNDVAIVYSTTPVEKEIFKAKKWGLNVMNSYSLEQYRRTRGPEDEKVIMTRKFTDRNFGTSVQTMEFKVQGDRLKQTRLVREIIRLSGESVLSYDLDFKRLGNAYPEDTYAPEMGGFLYRGLDMSRKSKFFYYWMPSERAVVPRYIKIKRPRKITVPAGTFKCYPIEMFVDVAAFIHRGGYLNRIVNPFMPDFVMYFDVDPPHYFVHYQGPLGGPGSPEVNLDLVKIVKGEQAIEETRRKLRSPSSYTDDGKLPDIF